MPLNYVQRKACMHTHSCLTLCDPMDCSPPGTSIHGISQAKILEWVAISSSKRKECRKVKIQIERERLRMKEGSKEGLFLQSIPGKAWCKLMMPTQFSTLMGPATLRAEHANQRRETETSIFFFIKFLNNLSHFTFRYLPLDRQIFILFILLTYRPGLQNICSFSKLLSVPLENGNQCKYSISYSELGTVSDTSYF